MEKSIEDTLRKFFSRYPCNTLTKHSILIAEGESPKGIFFLTKGLVRQYIISKDGNEVTLNIFKPLSFFPASLALSVYHNTYTFTALTEVEVYVAPKEDVYLLLRKRSEIALDLLRRLYIGMEGVLHHMEYALVGNVYQRVIAVFLTNAKRFGEKSDGKTEILLDLTHRDIAIQAGTA